MSYLPRFAAFKVGEHLILQSINNKKIPWALGVCFDLDRFISSVFFTLLGALCRRTVLHRSVEQRYTAESERELSLVGRFEYFYHRVGVTQALIEQLPAPTIRASELTLSCTRSISHISSGNAPYYFIQIYTMTSVYVLQQRTSRRNLIPFRKFRWLEIMKFVRNINLYITIFLFISCHKVFGTHHLAISSLLFSDSYCIPTSLKKHSILFYSRWGTACTTLNRHCLEIQSKYRPSTAPQPLSNQSVGTGQHNYMILQYIKLPIHY